MRAARALQADGAAGEEVRRARLAQRRRWVSVASELRWRRAVRSTRNPPSCSRSQIGAHQHAVPMVGYAWIKGQSNREGAGHANPPYKMTEGALPLPPQRLGHDLFAALAVLGIGHA